ncbi:hypothetical protein B0H34DRAFT_384067 [Crassisporium funariophilum]|nr:hypothetical protein B0H34DRAFT_384067 [Crassisporium funariophilum]
MKTPATTFYILLIIATAAVAAPNPQIMACPGVCRPCLPCVDPTKSPEALQVVGGAVDLSNPSHAPPFVYEQSGIRRRLGPFWGCSWLSYGFCRMCTQSRNDLGRPTILCCCIRALSEWKRVPVLPHLSLFPC